MNKKSDRQGLLPPLLAGDDPPQVRTEELRAALAQSEERYRAMIEAFEGYIYICSSENRIEFMNRRLVERTGYDATGQLCYQVLHDLNDVCPWCINEKVFRGEVVQWELESPKDGRWYHVTNTPLRNGDGTLSKQAMITDITDRKRMEAALRAREEQYRTILEEQTDVVGSFRADGTILYVNSACCRLYGKTAEELVGSSWQPRVVRADLPMVERQLEALCPDNPVVVCDNRVVAASGDIRWFQFVNRGVFDDSGRLVEILAVGRDTTANKHLEQQLHEMNDQLEERVRSRTAALRTSEEKFTKAFQSSPDAFILTTVSEGRIVEVNEATIRMSGYDKEELLGRTTLELDLWAETGARDRFIDQMRRDGRVRNFETGFRTKSGSVFSSWISGEILRLEDGPCFLSVIRDISPLKQAEAAHKRLAALTQDIAMAEERERCRIAGELHDQVAPNLLVCMMKLDELRARNFPEGEERIEAVVGLLNRTIQEIRSLTFQLRPPILANAGLSAALKWLASEFREKFGLRVTVHSSRREPALDYALQSTMFQVVRELLLNSAKHAGVEEASLVVGYRGGEEIVAIVQDRGRGFDPAAVLVPGEDCGGFGLFSIRQKVEHQGGIMEISAAPGKGTRIVVTLPVVWAADAGEIPA